MTIQVFFLILCGLYLLFYCVCKEEYKRAWVLGVMFFIMSVYILFYISLIYKELAECTESVVWGYLACSIMKLRIFCYYIIIAINIGVIIVCYVKGKQYKKILINKENK